MAAFAAVTIAITVRLYNSDILITGLGQSRAVQRILRRKRRETRQTVSPLN
jgi:hypothetical protein